jgi:hypothetical protein
VLIAGKKTANEQLLGSALFLTRSRVKSRAPECNPLISSSLQKSIVNAFVATEHVTQVQVAAMEEFVKEG